MLDRAVLKMFRAEITQTIALVGCATVGGQRPHACTLSGQLSKCAA